MGSAKDYPNVAEWKTKDTGYHTGDMVKYKSNIFRAAYWAGKEPGVDPGWSLYDELYDETSHSATQPAKLIGYLPTWRKDLDYGNAVIYQNITHGIIAFLQFDKKNLGELDDKAAKAVTAIVQQVVTTAHKAGTYISVAIGGATDYGFLNLLTAVGSNSSDARLDKAVQNVAKFVKDNALDGVDLDLECWWDANGDGSKDQGGRAKSKGAHPAGSALVSFAQKLKAALPGKLISATLFATSWYGNNYDPKLADQIDWLSIMSYDLTGSWNQSPVGPHTALLRIRKQDQYTAEQQGPWPSTAKGTTKGSTPQEDNPIFSVEDSLWYWSNPFFVNWQGPGQKVVRNKLVAGVPLYGYDFAYKKDPDPESGQTPPGYKVLRYKELVQQFPGASTAANANIKLSGNAPRPSFVSASGSYPYAHNIYLETPDTAAAKLNFLKQLGLQGVIIWEMSNEVWDDGKSIVKALYKASGNPATRPALPEPTFAKPGATSNGKEPVASGDLEASDAFIWSPDAKLPNDSGPYGTTGAPALAVFKDQLYCVHRGGGNSDDSGYLWVTVFDGSSWTGDKKLNVGAKEAPALAVYNDVLWCIHPGGGDNPGKLFFTNTSDGKSWEKDQLLQTSGNAVGISGAPALAVYKGKLWCVFRDVRNDDALSYITYNPTTKTWIDPTPLRVNAPPGSDTSIKAGGSPALAVFNELLYCVFQGSGSGNKSNLWYATFDGGTYWADRRQIKTLTAGLNKAGTLDGIVGSSDTPALAVKENFLYCIHRGGNSGNDGGYLWYTYGSGSPDDDSSKKYGFWRRDTQLKTGEGDPKGPFVPVAKVSGSGVVGALGAPALAVYKDRLYCVHPGGGNGNDRGYLWYTTNPPAGSPGATNQPNSDPVWVEAHGANNYLFYELDDTATDGQDLSVSKTIPDVARGGNTPFLIAVLTTDSDHAEFPKSAMLTITGPDGHTFASERNDDKQLAVFEGNSLKGLIIKDPMPGNYKIDLNVPKGTAFQFEFETIPSVDVVTTIEDALSAAYQQLGNNQHLQKRKVQVPQNKVIMLEIALSGISRLADMKVDPAVLRRQFSYMLERLIESLTGPGLRSSPKPTPTTPSSAKPTPVTRLTATLTTALTTTLATGKPALPISGNPSPTATPTSGISHPQFSINFQDGAGIRHYGSYRDLVAAIRTRFGQGQFTVRLDVFEDGETVWLRMDGSNFYVTAMNLSADDNASYLNQPGWLEFTAVELDYPNESQAQISPASINGAMQKLRSGARGEDIRIVPLPIIAFVLAEAARFTTIQYVTDAALDFKVGTDNQNAVRWNDYRDLIKSWQRISKDAYLQDLQPAISMLTVLFWATNNGPWTDIVNGRKSDTIGKFFEDLYILLQSLGYRLEPSTTAPTPLFTTPPTPTRTPPQH